jgi:hypothetical protein
VCQWLNWEGANGKPKEMSCRVALNKLDKRGIISLPPKGNENIFIPRKEWEYPIIAPLDCSLEEAGGIELIPVSSRFRETSEAWNGLMELYHYLGRGRLCGAQMRYLINNRRHGWLGALAFSAAAWHVQARDKWIGWDETQRRNNLPKVICNSRFLILPQIRIPNLASHVLSLAARRIGKDWQERYGFEPALMETYVERDRFQGTSYRAANWRYVGTTQGRGRQDRDRTQSLPVKDVYVYPLRPDACRVLSGGNSHPGVIKLDTRTLKSPEDWVEEELGGIDFGDKRLTQRLLGIVRSFWARPQASVPQACETRAGTKSAYRFFDHSRTNMDKILEQHYEATLPRIRQEAVVLAVQDTTSLNYSAHPATENLGPIGNELDGPIGLELHDTMAFNLEGTPLGLLHACCWARDPKAFGKRKLKRNLPIEQKESNKWLKSFRKVAEAQKQCPQTMFVSVGDREADIYDLFALATDDPSNPKLLVRAIQNRNLAKEQGLLWDKVLKEDVSGIQEIHVPRRGNQKARVARLEIRFRPVNLKAPRKGLPDLTVRAVQASEVEAPEGVKPLEWKLLTTCEVDTFEEAVEKLEWYTLRWGIEVYHRTLKSGCKIEERQLGCADRIETCLAIDMIVAWRIYHLTKLGREVPDVPCTVFFEEAEWKALVAYITKTPVPPEKPPSLREATRMMASLGGFLGRKCDGEPGTKSLWLGMQRLDDMTAMWKVMMSMYAPHPTTPPVSSNPGYG